MIFYDFFVSVDTRTLLMERMMRRFGVDRLLKHVPNHAAVTPRAIDRCRACGHQAECAGWLDRNEHPGEPPDYCRNSDLIARLRHAAGEESPR